MIQALYNILHWPLFWRRKEKEEATPEDKIEVDEKVGWGLFSKEDRKSCAILDTADRAAALLGKPALEVYLEIVKVQELWSHSESDTVSDIYKAGYVNNAEAMWKALIEMWTGYAVVPPPLPGAYASPELIFPELFKISEASRNLIVTVIPWAIYTYDWEEFLAKRATYWSYGQPACGTLYNAWRELEAVRGRPQPNIADVLNVQDQAIGWISPKTWFVGKFGIGDARSMRASIPGAEISIWAEMMTFLIMIRIRRGLGFSWNIWPIDDFFRAVWRKLWSFYGVNLYNYT